MKFEYTRPKITIEAYGKVYEIPTKIAEVIDGVSKAQTEIAEAKTAVEQIKAIKRGIAVFIGEEETERIFPSDKEASIDTDELSAFWFCLNSESNKATQAIIDKYAKKPISVTSKK